MILELTQTNQKFYVMFQARRILTDQHSVRPTGFPVVKDLSDLFGRSGVDTAKAAIEKLANCVIDKEPFTYTNPAIATALRTMLKEVAEMHCNFLSKARKIEVSFEN